MTLTPFKTSPARFSLKSLIDVTYFYTYNTLFNINIITGIIITISAIPIKLHGLRAIGI